MRAALFLIFAGCIGPKSIAPPPKPFPIEPSELRSSQGSAPSGAGSVILDVPGRSAHVFAVQKPYTTEATFVPLCDTPCSVNLPLGKHVLQFSDLKDDQISSFAEIEVAPGVTLVRHMIGYEKPLPSSIGLGGILLGGAGLTTFLVGIIAAAQAQDGGAGALGAALTSIGTAGIGGGWLLLWRFRTERQEGSTTVVKLR